MDIISNEQFCDIVFLYLPTQHGPALEENKLLLEKYNLSLKSDPIWKSYVIQRSKQDLMLFPNMKLIEIKEGSWQVKFSFYLKETGVHTRRDQGHLLGFIRLFVLSLSQRHGTKSFPWK